MHLNFQKVCNFLLQFRKTKSHLLQAISLMIIGVFHISTMTASIPMISMTKPGASLPRMRITTILMIFHAYNIRMTA
ncbi:hypothetical protein, partial [Phascolarctobacterium succinatutens]|uniref:hypothetical protein n=1 Tax=Phascolarctobacterium succinatutens TaxID=626940 RepID=UPI00307DD7FA